MDEIPADRAEAGSANDLLALVYAELRVIAAAHLRSERPGHTLRPTDLVHEAFLRLHGHGSRRFGGRTHFLAVASRAMRRVLVDHARARSALKRGGDPRRVSLDDGTIFAEDRTGDLLAVDEALDRLAMHDPDVARVVEMRFFGGMTEKEVAAELGITDRWARKQWAYARAWLKREMSRE